MTLNSDIKAIHCTSCGAGLDVLGGGRVTTHVCSYCGAELDAVDGYAVLKKYTNQTRTKSPLSIGMKGELFGVDFVIIGIMAHEERYNGRVWMWVDHQVFSPTHGYAWITVENGHFTFSRRFRHSAWMTVATVETSENRPSLYVDGERYRYYDSGISQMTYVEGEFTWRPEVERTSTVSVMSKTAMLSFSQTNEERETYREVYVTPTEIETGFNIKLEASPRGVHPLQSLKKSPNFDFLKVSAAIFAAMCLVLSLGIGAISGTPVLQQRILLASLPVALDFPVEVLGKLTRIAIKGDGQNSWHYMDVDLSDPEDDDVFTAGRTVEYYAGRTQGESWSEGSNFASIQFIPEMSGTYKLSLSGAESGAWSDQGAYPSRLNQYIMVWISNGHSSGFWMGLLALCFGLLSAYFFGQELSHKKRRWANSDWTDED